MTVLGPPLGPGEKALPKVPGWSPMGSGEKALPRLKSRLGWATCVGSGDLEKQKSWLQSQGSWDGTVPGAHEPLCLPLCQSSSPSGQLSAEVASAQPTSSPLMLLTQGKDRLFIHMRSMAASRRRTLDHSSTASAALRSDVYLKGGTEAPCLPLRFCFAWSIELICWF